MGNLILIRHGRTVLNTNDDRERLRGWLDVSLDAQGFREAEITAVRVARHPVVQIYTSDLLRARQTAGAVARTTNAPVVSTHNLRPWNLGSLAGRRVAEVLPILERLERDLASPAPEGESFLSFYERYSRALSELLEIASRTKRNVVVVTHVRNLLATPSIVAGGDKTQVPMKGGPGTASLTWVEQHGKRWRLRVDQPENVFPQVRTGEPDPAPSKTPLDSSTIPSVGL